MTNISQMKFVIMLREPVARAYSYWAMAKLFTDRKLPGEAWAYRLVADNATFESRAIEMMDGFDGCMNKRPMNSDADNWITCHDNTLNAMLDSTYDQQISMWREIFPANSFCIVDDDFLRMEQTKALTAIARFIGLPQFDWSSLEVHVHDHFNGTHAPLPIDATVERRLSEFFARYGTYYYEQVREHGFWGCRPDAAAEQILLNAGESNKHSM